MGSQFTAHLFEEVDSSFVHFENSCDEALMQDGGDKNLVEEPYVNGTTNDSHIT
jgi:hypothetical protein